MKQLRQRPGVLVGLLLGGALILLLVAVWLAGSSADQPGERAGQALLPELRDQVNDVDAVDVIGPGGQTLTRLRREDQRWQVRERHGYDADFDQVRDLLLALADARIIEPKTSREAWYAHLDVEDIDHPTAGGVVFRFPGTELGGVIVGKSSDQQAGHYVRREGEAQSWLINRILPRASTPVEWLERSIMDIPAEDMGKVVIRHPDGELIRIHGTGMPDPPFVLSDIPEGRTLRNSRRLAEVADGLANLVLEDVRPHDSVPEGAVRALFTTLDGLNFVASVFRDDEGHWVNFQVSAETPPLGEDEHLDQQDSDRLTGAVAVDARLSPWQFRLSQSRYNRLTRNLEYLLEPASDETVD